MAPEYVDVTADTKIASHPVRVHLPVLVAPSTGDAKFNTVRAPLLAIGCWKLPDGFFDFDSTFVLPAAAVAFQKFAEFRTELAHPETGEQPPASIFGHADATGPEPYNSMLSAHRAAAVYAILTRDLTLFDKVRSDAANTVGKPWGDRADRKMLSLVLDPDTKAPYYTPPDGKAKRAKATSDAIRRFQQVHSQPETGALTPKQRKDLMYPEYMDALCHLPDAEPVKGARYVMDPASDFLARGKGERAHKGEYKGDFQGCGEFNPVMYFSRDEDKRFANPANHKERDQKNRRNRRVLIFLFKHGTVIEQSKWPCPNFGEQGVAQAGKCHERLWSDAERRDKDRLPDKRRWFEDQEDTFRCRFYHGIAVKSPCEELAEKLWKLRMVTLDSTGAPQPIIGRRYVVKAGDARAAAVVRGTSDDDGTIAIPMFDERGDMTLLFDGFGADSTVPVVKPTGDAAGLSPPPPPGHKPTEFGDDEAFPDEDEFLAFTLAGGTLVPLVAGDADQDGVKQRLHNLGFGPPEPATWSDDVRRAAVIAWQELHKRDKTGVLSTEERELLRGEYGDDRKDPHADEETDLAVDDDQDD